MLAPNSFMLPPHGAMAPPPTQMYAAPPAAAPPPTQMYAGNPQFKPGMAPNGAYPVMQPSFGSYPQPLRTMPGQPQSGIPQGVSSMPQGVTSMPGVAGRPTSTPPMAGTQRATPGPTQAQPAQPQSMPLRSIGTMKFSEEKAPPISIKDRRIMEEAGKIFEQIDAGSAGAASKLELLGAVKRNPNVAKFVLPGVEKDTLQDENTALDAVDTMFSAIAGGRKRKDIRKHTFIRFFRKVAGSEQLDSEEIRELFDDIDGKSRGSFSRLELLQAVQKNHELADVLLPGEDCNDVMNNPHCFDALDEIFDEIAGGKPRASFADFDLYIRLHQASAHTVKRHTKRVLVIGIGFLDINPQMSEVVSRAGYVVHYITDLPDPDRMPASHIGNYLGQIKKAIDQFHPHLIACASKGGLYVQSLWQSRLWTGPVFMANVHPSIKSLPEDVPIVLAHGSNDELYQRSRNNLQQLVSSGTANMCFLYYSANSGKSASGQCSRVGDTHQMLSLLAQDLLPRLMDAAMSHQCPETHLLWSCQHRLTQDRLDAEQWLGYDPDKLRQHWATDGQDGNHKLYEVAAGTEEFKAVESIFYAAPRDPPAYTGAPGLWERTRLLKVERVENGLLEGGAAEPYYESLRRSIEEQGIPFEEGVHSRWGFHGTEAYEAILNDPLTGFQPLTSGARLGTVWGSGTYFARDARYVVDSNFCSSKKMLMCLMMTGIPCLGDPEQHGVLPFRQKPHRYNCAVDSMSSPEVFVLHHPGAAYPAYLISFSN